jgi:IS30 family transposase
MARVKLTAHDRDLIRELAKEGLSAVEIADKFEVHKSTIERLVSNKIWGKQNAAKTAPTESSGVTPEKFGVWQPEARFSRSVFLRQNYHRSVYPEIGSRERKKGYIYL